MRKGQLTMQNLIGVFLVMVITVYLLPVLQSITNSTISTAAAAGNTFSPTIISLLNLFPIAIAIAIIVGAITLASLRPQQ